MGNESSGYSRPPWLLVLAGRPGTGKTTLAQAVVRATGACYLRVDVVETVLSHAGWKVGAAGYGVAHGLAASNLLLGNDVVVDAVNAVPAARAGWSETAQRGGARLVLVETLLPDVVEHQRRVENRTADIPGHRMPSWDEVRAEPWVAWDESRDGQHHVVDTTNSERAHREVLSLLDAQ